MNNKLNQKCVWCVFFFVCFWFLQLFCYICFWTITIHYLFVVIGKVMHTHTQTRTLPSLSLTYFMSSLSVFHPNILLLTSCSPSVPLLTCFLSVFFLIPCLWECLPPPRYVSISYFIIFIYTNSTTKVLNLSLSLSPHIYVYISW